MPLRAALANPIVFATMTVIAIGIITYQILKNKKRVPTRGRTLYRCIDNGSHGPDKPDEGPGKFDKGDDDGDGKGKISNGDDDGNAKGKVCNETESENSSNAFSGVRKRTIATQTADASKAKNLKPNCSEGISQLPSVSNSNNENLDLASTSSVNRESQYTAQQNSEMQKELNDISQVNSSNTFVTNLHDEDSDSSESNNLKMPEKSFVANIDDEDSDSSESNDSLQIDNNNMDMGESICNAASSFNASRSKNIRTPSPTDSFEENYKRDVCSHLKTDLVGEHKKGEKCYKYSSDEESDTSENNFSTISDESNASGTFKKKPELCKGCLEEFANAVAYPCKHCYLCLDCAVKVHRIFKKCTICSSVIKTFEQLKM